MGILDSLRIFKALKIDVSKIEMTLRTQSPQHFSTPICNHLSSSDGKMQQKGLGGFCKTYPMIPNSRNLRKYCEFYVALQI